MSADPACPLCGSRGPKAFVRAWEGYRLYDCPDCGAGFCDPFKNPGPEYYEHKKDFYSSNLDETTDPMSYEYDEALRLIAREYSRGARVLDVGCGAGGFLHRGRAEGLVMSGVDFNPARVKALRERGFAMFEGGLPAFAATRPEPFGVVTAFQVLEHVDDLGGWLRAARDVLQPHGLLVVGVPNRGRRFDPFQGPGLGEIDNPPHHLTRWSAAALSRAIGREGFSVDQCRPLGYPVALLQLMARNTLRAGLAVRALGVEQVSHVDRAPSAPSAKDRAVRALVAVKQAVLDAAVLLLFPLFKLAEKALGWQGAVLFAVGRKPR